MNSNPLPQRDDWFITDRKPTICPRYGKKEVRKAVLGYPIEEDFFNENIYLVGCIPDFPVERNWICRNCDAAFFKDNIFNRGRLDMVAYRDKEGRLRLVNPKSIPQEEIPF
tara:strand:+ start:75 stop:407 length:333 start_codon:yes stop_codon:yes gene_type:complete